MNNIGNLLFILAGTLWGIELLPQLWKTYKTKSIGDFSPFFLTLCLIAYSIFMVGCYLIGNWWLLFSHVLPLINVCILCVFYNIYKNNYDKNLPHFIINKQCRNYGGYICNLKYKCNNCPYNIEKEKSNRREE